MWEAGGDAAWYEISSAGLEEAQHPVLYSTVRFRMCCTATPLLIMSAFKLERFLLILHVGQKTFAPHRLASL